MSGIRHGSYVCVRSGMYRGTMGFVRSIGVSASGPYALIDVGDGPCIGVYVSALDVAGTETTAEQERDRLRREVESLRDHVDASWEDECPIDWITARLDAILRGGS